MRHPRCLAASLALTLAVLGLLARPASGQVQLIDMVPRAASAETVQDAEPSLTVNPANPLQIAASAFTWDSPQGSPMRGATAPIYTSTDGGQTWNLVLSVPSTVGAALPTGDIMLHFTGSASGATSLLYAGILRAPLPGQQSIPVQVLRTTDYRLATPMTVLDQRTSAAGVDQPHLRAATVVGGPAAGKDRVYVGFNNLGTPRTATVDFSLDAAVRAPSFDLQVIETRNTLGQDGYANVPAIHPDGTIYVVFYGWREVGELAHTVKTDVVVVRDDNWGSGAIPFAALTDPSDGRAGRLVVTGRTLIVTGGASVGQQRLGASNLAIAVDPRNSRTVYIAWADQPSGTFTQTLHVRRSTDGGASWSVADLLAVADAVNPSLAINSRGTVAFLYQQLVGTPPDDRWETRLIRTTDAGGTVWDGPGVLLADTPASTPEKQYDPYLGDYDLVIASGESFLGVFSANNYPDRANFHPSIVYQRYVDWSTHQLFRDAARTVPVAPSIDPFFFKVTE